jgi:membrane protein YdbS with pleckstrin-like domain
VKCALLHRKDDQTRQPFGLPHHKCGQTHAVLVVWKVAAVVVVVVVAVVVVVVMEMVVVVMVAMVVVVVMAMVVAVEIMAHQNQRYELGDS